MTNEELALRAQAGDLDARNQLWEAVRRLCYKLAHRFFPLCQRAGIERADLKQELFFGFLAALDAFDPDKGYLFNSYLEYTVRKACANALGIRNGKRLDPPASLQTPVGEDCDELQDLIPDTTSGQPFEDAENRVFNEQLHAALDTCLDALDDRRRETICARFYDGLTLAEVSKQLGCSPQRVRQLEKDGLRELRKPQYTRRLAPFREQIISTRSYHGTGYQAWKRCGSVQERTLVYLENKGLL